MKWNQGKWLLGVGIILFLFLLAFEGLAFLAEMKMKEAKFGSRASDTAVDPARRTAAIKDGTLGRLLYTNGLFEPNPIRARRIRKDASQVLEKEIHTFGLTEPIDCDRRILLITVYEGLGDHESEVDLMEVIFETEEKDSPIYQVAENLYPSAKEKASRPWYKKFFFKQVRKGSMIKQWCFAILVG